MTEILTKTRH